MSSTPSYQHLSTPRPMNHMHGMFSDRMRLNPQYPEIYPPPFNPMMYPYSPPPPVPPPPPPNAMGGYFNIPTADMTDGPMDYSMYNSGYPVPPYPYNMYYSMASPRNPYHSPFRSYREEIDELNEKRARKAKLTKAKAYEETPSPSELNPDSLKSMLYDTLQQEMSALEVLKQQIASFTLLSHSMEHTDRRSSTSTDVPRVGLATPSDTPKLPDIKPTNFLPQFDSTAGQSNYPQKQQIASQNFIQPGALYTGSLNYPTEQRMQVLQYNPYVYPSFMPLQSQINDNAQPSFVTLPAAPDSIAPPAPIRPTYAPAALPIDPISVQYANFIPQPLPVYSNVLPLPANYLNPVLGADSYPDQFHDMAIKTLYDVEKKLREAEEKISEKISEFETEVSAQSVAGPKMVPMAYNPYHNGAYQQPHQIYAGRRQSVESSESSDMNPSMVKQLAVRALQAIDRRLRAAEKTIDKTINNNFDGMRPSAERAVKSSTREIGVQTPQREIVYDSDTDDYQSNQNHTSDS